MKRITLFIVTTIILLGMWLVLDYRQDTQVAYNDEQTKIVSIQNDLQGILGKCDNIISLSKNAELVIRIEQLVQENVSLRQEVESLKSQLKATSWYKESEEIQQRYGGDKQ